MHDLDEKKQGDLVMMIMALGEAYLDKGLFSAAAKRYRLLIDFNVENRQLYTGLSKAYIGLKRIDKHALEVYQRAIEYDTENSEVFTTLAAMFMKENRSDAAAIDVYERALKHDTPIFERLATFLARAYFTQQNYARCKEVTENLFSRSYCDPNTLVLYLKSCWIGRKYNDATNQLKRLIDATEDDTLLLKYLCMTYLEKVFHAELQGQELEFSFIDRKLVSEHFRKSNRFESLQDLSLYLELKKFYLDQKYWPHLEPSAAAETAESYMYEAVPESSDSPRRVQRAGAHQFCIQNEILGRLASFESLTGRKPGPRSLLTFADFEKKGSAIFSDSSNEGNPSNVRAEAEILITVQLSNYDSSCKNYGVEHAGKVRKKLYVMLIEMLEKYEIADIWGTSNGLLVFANDVVAATSFSIEILNKLNRYNFVNDPKDEIHLAISIHHSREGFSGNAEQCLKDLSIGLKLGIVSETSLTSEDRPIYGKIFKKSDKILLSGKAYREIKNVHRFKVNSVGQFRLKYLKETLSLHEVAWRNPIDDLKFGYINKLGRFDLLVELGNKGAIKVFKAKDAVLQRFVIIKVVQSEPFNALPANNRHKLEFYSRSRSLAQMNHPNIINIYEVDEDQGLTYIAREFAEGCPITEIFEGQDSFDPDRLVKLTFEICKGLQYCHRAGFLHGNLKPRNILIGSADEVKIMDFLIPEGLLMDPAQPSEKQEELSYWAPEQIRGQDGDARSDVFSLGVILYEVMTGRYAFPGETPDARTGAIQHRMPPWPSELNPAVPKFCEAFVLKCMAKNPDKRFQTVEEMVTLLKNTFERSLFSNFNYQIARSRD